MIFCNLKLEKLEEKSSLDLEIVAESSSSAIPELLPGS